MFGYPLKPTFAVENEQELAKRPKSSSSDPHRHRRSGCLGRRAGGAGRPRAGPATPEPRHRPHGTLTPAQQQELEERLRQFETRKGSQLAALIVPTTAPETIEQFGIRAAEAWKLGRKAWTTAPCSSSPKTTVPCASRSATAWKGLPDAISKPSSRRSHPRFREGDFYGGISAGSTA